MQRAGLLTLTSVMLLAMPAAILAEAGSTRGTTAAPPSRPAGLTLVQFDSLRQLEAQPSHAAVLNVHATYASDRERHLDFIRASDDFWTAVYQTGFPGTIAAILICAAPL